MRSSNKNRSRNKNSRKSIGNVVNRVFESAGPEGKVRGTPAQIIEKYATLARDAQTSGDRVAAENFLQHSEHYTRLLNEAMRENAVRQQEVAAQQGNNGQQSSQQPSNPQPSLHANGSGPQPEVVMADTDPSDRPLETIEQDGAVDGGLVTTPESGTPAPDAAPAPARRPRNTRRRKPPAQVADSETAATPQEPEAPATT